jgi:hypothetical protein
VTNLQVAASQQLSAPMGSQSSPVSTKPLPQMGSPHCAVGLLFKHLDEEVEEGEEGEEGEEM